MSRSGVQLKNLVIFVHRWMGVSFCLLFLLWFSSGIVLMYWDYPGVQAADRLARTQELDTSRIKFLPEQAYARLGASDPPSAARLVMFDGRPLYRFGFDQGESMVYADDGEPLDEFPPDMTLRIASSWTGQSPSTANVKIITEPDQWTVSAEFQPLRPMMKYSWPNGEQVYVSTVTGDVAQYTTRASRMGAYLGAIPHWLYFTPLRKHAPQWSKLVIWASGLATIVAILGIVVGIWMFSPAKHYSYSGSPARIPYAGQKRWHMILGLLFGLVACTWAFSGMLSMDPFPPAPRKSDDPGPRIANALRGGSLQMDAFASMHPQEAVSAAGADFKVKELELTMFAGEPAYLAIAAPDRTRVIEMGASVGGKTSRPARVEIHPEFDRDRIIEVLRKAAQPDALSQVRTVTEYEAYYLDRHHRLPLPVIFARLDDSENSTFYIDPKTARIVQSYTASSRWNRWLYHGLHSIDLPWLYKHRPAWDIVVLTLMFGGGSLCVTSLILAWRVIGRKLISMRS